MANGFFCLLRFRPRPLMGAIKNDQPESVGRFFSLFCWLRRLRLA